MLLLAAEALAASIALLAHLFLVATMHLSMIIC